MGESEILKGKKILVVDDEPDILETLVELLDMCNLDTAPNYETAVKFLDEGAYDAAIFDIMGVSGYDLLKLANEKGIPAIMLTAHALTPENLVKTIKGGAKSYVPKDKIADIAFFTAEVIQAREEGTERHGRWLTRLKPFFDKKFGPDWKERDKEFWKEFDRKYIPSREDLEKML